MRSIIKSMKPSICFISKSIHYVLLNDTVSLVGGAEVQQKILADAFADRGWKVFIITERVDDRKRIELNRHTIIFPVLDYEQGNKYLRKVIYLPLNLWSSLRQIDADIYYHRNPDYLSGVIALFCKLNGKRFVLAGANDWNFDKGNERNLNSIVDKISARCAIKFADKLIVQNSNQRELVRSNFRRESTLFYNIFFERERRMKSRYILWVGRIESYKRPKLFLELARRLPDNEFVMVGGKGSDISLKREIEQEAASLENVTYLGHQPFEKVEGLFDETAVFVNTSIPGCEGFPNTFLQSWSRGIPVVSFFDPDELISMNNLGICVGSIEEMKKSVKYLVREHQGSAEHTQRIQGFFLKTFSAEDQISNLIRMIIK